MQPCAAGDSRSTPYAWMRDPSRRASRVLLHLKAVDAHARATLQTMAGQQLLGRMRQETEQAVWAAALHMASLSADGEEGGSGSSSSSLDMARQEAGSAAQHR